MAAATPPRFVIRTLVATLATVAFVLSAVLLVGTLKVQTSVRAGVVDRLERVSDLLKELESRRGNELAAQVSTLAENSTLKAAVDTYHSELRTTNRAGRQDLLATISHELEKLAARIQPDVLEVRSPSGEVLAIAGRRASEWPAFARVNASPQEAAEVSWLTTPSGIFRLASVPVVLQGSTLGTLTVASAIDDRYAAEISELSRAQTLILSKYHVVASTLPAELLTTLKPNVVDEMVKTDIVTFAGSEYAVKSVLNEGGAQVYVLDSIDASARPIMAVALRTIGWIALGAFTLAALASVWLSRTIARPIDTLSASLASMTETRNFENPLAPGGDILEIDALTATFNTMIQTVKAAEEERLSAYVGTIRALALALDARDPYTAGHSERVSALSLAIGRCLWLDETQLEVLRLGALLHDIGKIGISDHVLMKPGPLSADEYETIKQHPVVGARILRSVPFLEPHIPIVELHHERPDGKGYPHGLRGTEIPLLASIVHVADAFDAITSARAYRPARAASDGLRELWRHAGAQFDAEVVHALAKALPDLDRVPASSDNLFQATPMPVPLKVIRA